MSDPIAALHRVISGSRPLAIAPLILSWWEFFAMVHVDMQHDGAVPYAVASAWIGLLRLAGRAHTVPTFEAMLATACRSVPNGAEIERHILERWADPGARR